MNVLLTVWAWIVSHPVLAAGVLTGAASLAYKKLDTYPRVHAFLSILAGFGLDLPTILDGIRRLFAGSPPTAGKMGPYRTNAKDPDPPVKPPSVAARLAYSCVWLVFFAGMITYSPTYGCTKQQGQQVVQAIDNLTPAGACIAGQVASGNVDPLSILGICGPITIEDIIKEVDALLAAPQSSPDGGVQVKRSVEYTTHLLTLKANCQKYLFADGGGQ